ncbi:caffeine-induced death protein-like protein Cid2 [Patellaria atrata CBS 101060]|uniref:Caffeine-induced death protein-like protein Cid2 n=1 Tax=Patellaria atrata CBS 101060 TaxID=1346257 RepID=A0A9P4SG90_9PEZI|nr:caffeine-induced death protein-like protein Cid2 [Patellaria atrata CBS 101060]
MARQPSETPKLTPQFCFNQSALRYFLRLSRSVIDDSITQSLNALVAPSSKGFDPSSTSTRQNRLPLTYRLIDPSACRDFKNNVLFPSWEVRSRVLSYCAGVATSPDPDDPDQLLREVESARARERVVDERLDPYSGRYFPREARTESLAALIRNERSVENIIRARTWALVGERCVVESAEADEALNEWRRKKEGNG